MSTRLKTASYKLKRIKRERGAVCEKCGYKGFLELHHIVHVKDGGGNEDSNLALLCEKCHAKVHGWKKKNWLDPKRKNWRPSGVTYEW